MLHVTPVCALNSGDLMTCMVLVVLCTYCVQCERKVHVSFVFACFSLFVAVFVTRITGKQPELSE